MNYENIEMEEIIVDFGGLNDWFMWLGMKTL